MKIIFFGNSKYSAIGANIIHTNLGIAQIITIPDSPVKIFAIQNNIPTLETKKIDQESIEIIKKIEPDFLIVEDYGLILPQSLLKLPKYAPLNIHHSLLPKYRGPAPAPNAILNGEKKSGVTIIKMSNKVDAGDILAQKEYLLKPDETTDSLLIELNRLGGNLIIPVINSYLSGNFKPEKQDDLKATLTKYMKKSDGYFDINNPPSKDILDRMIRAYYPWPGVWTTLKFENTNKTRGGELGGPPSSARNEAKRSEDIGRGKRETGPRQNAHKLKTIKLLPANKIQMEGKKPMSYKDFFNGYPELKEKLTRILPD